MIELNSHTEYINEARSDFRINENKRLSWHLINSESEKGQGRIKNISTSGMLLETNYKFAPNDRCIFYIDPNLGDKDYVPNSGRLVWHRKSFLRDRYLCGFEFDPPAQDVLSRLKERVEKGKTKLTLLKRLTVVLDSFLSVGIVALFAVVVLVSAGIYTNLKGSNTRLITASSQQAVLVKDYADKYHQSQEEVARVTQELEVVTNQLVQTSEEYQQTKLVLQGVQEDLAMTKALLGQTEELLAQAKEKNVELQGLAETKVRLEQRVAELEEKNTQLSNEMTVMGNQIRFLSGDVANQTEGEEFLRLYKNKMKQVKQRLKDFAEEARKLRENAKAEYDRLKMILGNNGFLVKDGSKVVVDEEKYNSLTVDAVQSQTAPKPKVDVDVTISGSN